MSSPEESLADEDVVESAVADEDTAVEIFPFQKGSLSPFGKDFTIRAEPADVEESIGDEDPKDSSAIESALSSGSIKLVPEEPPVDVVKVPEETTSEPSKPTSSTTPTTSPGKPAQPVVVPTPSSSSPSAAK